ncbi:inorganic pyrophosphatase, partial [Achromobacter xylosoxidans]
LPAEDTARIHNFLDHYKDLEKGKCFLVKGW